MQSVEAILKQIQNLYKTYGYTKFKMNKFEEYDTYVKNKDFLVSDKVITFTDTNGKLLAMKPDVTISIIKNTDCEKDAVRKLYYSENVYRVTKGSHSFKEILQCGLECIGDVDSYSICEVLCLAAKSLLCISFDAVLDISHMGLVSALLKYSKINEQSISKVLNAISEKNIPELKTICDEQGVEESSKELILKLVLCNGAINDVKEKLQDFCVDELTTTAVNELKEICENLCDFPFAKIVHVDFSVVNDMNYYDGIVFKGYVEGVPGGVLSGGQYDRLVEKMGKKAKALGFALYLDMLERLFTESKEYDADILICYEDGVLPQAVFEKVEMCIQSGKTVLVAKDTQDKIKCKDMIVLKKEEK